MGHLVIVRLFGSERFLKMGELVKMRSFFVLRGSFVLGGFSRGRVYTGRVFGGFLFF